MRAKPGVLSSKPESNVQNDIRNSLCDDGLFFRANVGMAWASNDIYKLPNGDIVLKNPRPFSTGLPAGFSDVFGATIQTITPDMVGQTVAIFTAVEAKSSTGKAREAQERFIAAIKKAGGRAGFARSVEQAQAIVRGE